MSDTTERDTGERDTGERDVVNSPASEPRTYYRAPEPQGPAETGQVILKDGSTAYLRPARSEDKDLLIRFFRGYL